MHSRPICPSSRRLSTLHCASACCRRRIQELLEEMEAKGIQVAPSGPSALGMQASAAAASVQLPAIPLTPPVQPLASRDEADLEPPATAAGVQGEAAAGGGGSEAAPAAAAAPGAAPPAADAAAEGPLSPGAALTAASHQARIRAEEAAAAKQASAQAREKGNASFKKHQWEQVGWAGLLRAWCAMDKIPSGCVPRQGAWLRPWPRAPPPHHQQCVTRAAWFGTPALEGPQPSLTSPLSPFRPLLRRR